MNNQLLDLQELTTIEQTSISGGSILKDVVTVLAYMFTIGGRTYNADNEFKMQTLGH